MAVGAFVVGEYDAAESVLHIRHPGPVNLDNAERITAFFAEVRGLIESCSEPPYLLVDYANLEISVDMQNEYADQLKLYRRKVRGVFRYGLSEDMAGRLTGVAVRLGNRLDANIFEDEATARAALQSVRSDGPGP